MSSRAARAVAAAVLMAASACSPIEDTVFAPVALAPAEPLVVAEGAGVVELPLRLSEARAEPLRLAYRFVATEAQNNCQTPDFEAAEGFVEWSAGAVEARVRVFFGDDDLAETDERFEIELASPADALDGAPAAAGRVEVVIADDDRSALVEARSRGLEPGTPGDRTAALQAVLDEAAGLGRAVVRLAPGDYDVSSVRLGTGTTLSARGVRWHRPENSAADVVTLTIEHEGAESSAATLVEDLTIDGRRDAQGPYRNHERQDAHLVRAAGDRDAGGRARVTFERLTLVAGTGSGLVLDSDTEIAACDVSASELWRDAVTALGGASLVRLRNLDATAAEGTGLWLGARNQGYDQSLALDVAVENAHVGAGDVEIEGTVGSRIDVRGLVMTRPPFRLDAPNGVVRLAGSVLVIGLSSAEHNHFALPHDVEIADTTLVVSESADAGAVDEQARAFSAASIRAESAASGSPADGPGRLAFERCRFELDADVEPDDAVYAVESPSADLAVTVRGGALGAGFAGWFAPACADCTNAP